MNVRTERTVRRRATPAAWLALVLLVALLGGGPPRTTSHAADGLRLAAASSPKHSGVTIRTVPAVAGFPVILDGITVITDAQGQAHFPVAGGGLVPRIALNEAIVPINGRDVKVAASRVYRQSKGGDSAQLVLDQSYRVHFDFTDMKGGSVDASVITTVTVKSVTGAVVDLPAHQDNWLQGSRVVPLMGGLDVKNLDWTVQRVQYSGSNVVNASQQKFLPAMQSDVTVKLLFYRVRLAVQDAVFGHSQSGAVDLQYPDGRSRRFDLDEHGRLTLPALPRGNYTVTTIGPGPRLSRPLALSRNQVVELSFYSWLDIAVVGAVVLLLAVGLPTVGWRRRRRARRPRPPAEDDGEPGVTRSVDVPEVART